MANSGRIAFFDLDKTLIRRNSATLWIRHELADGGITRTQALRALSWVVRYHFGIGNLPDAIRRTVTTIEGRREDQMRERVVLFYEEQVRPLYRPGAIETVRQHRQSGDRLVLLTSASDYIAELVCRDLALDDYVCNRFVVDESGCYTGRVVEPMCFAGGKVVLAERFCATKGYRLAEASFYTDSHSDVPMLEAVGRPVAVHPDPKLRRLARRRGWQTVDWDEPRMEAGESA